MLAEEQVLPCQGGLQKQVDAEHPEKLVPPVLRPVHLGPVL